MTKYSDSYLVANSFLEDNEWCKDRIIRDYDEECLLTLMRKALLGIKGLNQGTISMILDKTVENELGCEKHIITLYVEEGNIE